MKPLFVTLAVFWLWYSYAGTSGTMPVYFGQPVYYFETKQTVNKPIWHEEAWTDRDGGLRPGKRFE